MEDYYLIKKSSIEWLNLFWGLICYSMGILIGIGTQL